MRELGINVEETAVMSSLTPVVGILMPPLAGLIADKIGNFKIMLTLFSVCSGLSALLLLTIPIGRVTVTYPDRVVLGMSCNAQNPLILSLYEEYPCENDANMAFTSEISVESCGYVCQAYVDTADGDAILRAQYYDIMMHNIKENKTSSVKVMHPTLRNVNITNPPKYKIDDDIKNHMKLQNDERYTTVVRRYSKHSYYFPATAMFNFSCALTKPDGSSKDDAYNHTNAEHGFDLPVENYECKYSTKNVLRSFVAGIKEGNKSDDDMNELREMFQVRYLNLPQGKHNAYCAEGYGQNKEYLSVRVDLSKENTTDIYRTIDLGTCAPRCIASAPREKFCKNSKRVIEKDVNLTFWTYLGVRVFIGIIGGTAYTMFEGAVIAILREYKADYGLQRMYAQLGGMISSPLSGLLIDYASEGKGYTDFRPIFFLYCGLKVTSAVLMLFINLEFKTPASSVVADVKSVIKVELVSLFVAAFLLGAAWGYIESYLFWLLDDLGGTKSLMGLTITVGGILGIPLLAFSGPLIKKFGHANIIFIGFLAYAVRLYGYSIIYNPWYSLIFEAMECLTHSLCFTALITYAAKLSSVTTDTTIQGIIGGLFYGVGKSGGSLVGGYLIKFYGMRATFQMFAATTFLTAFLYFAFFHLYMKSRTDLRKEKEDEIEEKDTKANGISELNKGLPDKDKDKDDKTHTNQAFEETEMKTKTETDNNANVNKEKPDVNGIV